MSVTGIPREVWSFIEHNIDTVPQLEALLLIYASGDRAWSVEDLAARIYVGGGTALDILETLKRRALIASVDESRSYRRAPASAGQSALIEAVANAYRQHLVPIATFIHKSASAPVREFARAFELKKDH